VAQQHTPAKLSLTERRVTATKLRMTGQSYLEIANYLGMSKSGVFSMIKTEHRKAIAKMEMDIQVEAAIDLERIDYMITKLWTGVDARETDAINSMVRCLERRSRMIGYDAKDRVPEDEYTDADVLAELDKVIEGEVSRRIEIERKACGLDQAIEGETIP